MKKIFLLLSVLVVMPVFCKAGWFSHSKMDDEPQVVHFGNRHSQSFYAVKKEMLEKIYYDREHRRTLYCNAEFLPNKKLILPEGFTLPDIKNVDFTIYDTTQEELQMKALRLEWEHIVPAQNFGKTFHEWYDGHENCVSSKGKKFKGRACAEKENEEFRYMYTDMYNLYPVIGAVNHLRAHFNFAQFTHPRPATFGVCGGMAISHNKVEPRDEIKGFIARTYLYMQYTYPRYRISENMASLLKVWDRQYPVTQWECQRAYHIEKVQGNANMIVKPRCEQSHMYWEAD